MEFSVSWYVVCFLSFLTINNVTVSPKCDHLTDESFEDWLIHLQSRDKLSLTDELTNSSENTWPLGDSFSPSVISSIVYKWCQQLKQPMGVPHRTVELYERFFRIHYRSSFVSTSAIDSLKPNMLNKSQWQEIYTEIRHQSLLYLVSCLQIASKLENGYKVRSSTL